MSAPDLGTDVACLYDCNGAFSLVSGIANLGRALGRRLITPRGTLDYAPDYGDDLRKYLNADLTSSSVAAAVRADAIAECLKDERVQSITAQSAFDPAARTLTLTLLGTTAAGPFRLVLAIGDVTVDVLTAQQGG